MDWALNELIPSMYILNVTFVASPKFYQVLLELIKHHHCVGVIEIPWNPL